MKTFKVNHSCSDVADPSRCIFHLYQNTLLEKISSDGTSTVVSSCVNAVLTLTIAAEFHLSTYSTLIRGTSLLLMVLNFIHHCHTHNHSCECPSDNAAILKYMWRQLYNKYKIFSPQSLNLMISYLSSFDMYYSHFILV